ncbi:SDR family oxidoreductase [Vallitalea okinawensis]|uniref:SDR family oxidoreductase n=1 Tax=Vallitalea okinawensis TaxID=2078660 RepID=UPI000CFDEB7C|nr:SDR family oxidoreductase [Vallitalea okinawensis]
MNILMTGSTGIVGLPCLKLFLEEGHNVYCIVREKNGELPSKRLKKALKLNNLPKNLNIMTGDIKKPLFELSSEDLSMLNKASIDIFFHCAALTKMEDRYHKESILTNIEGTKHAISLGKALNIPHFHYISTAYVANGGSNIYELNKEKSEQIIQSSNIPYTISRLAIVIGDTATGQISDFTGMYGYFLAAYRIVKKSNYKTMLEAEASEGATLNLIPADWTAKTLSLINEKGPSNTILNIVDENPLLVETVYDYGFKSLGIDQNTITVRSLDTTSSTATRYQKMFNFIINIFRPYTSKQFIASTKTLREHLQEDYVKAPSMTYDLIDKCLQYALITIND